MKKYPCSVCGDTVELMRTDRWSTTPMWIGMVRFGFCVRCNTSVTLLRDEHKVFIGTHSKFCNPATEKIEASYHTLSGVLLR